MIYIHPRVLKVAEKTLITPNKPHLSNKHHASILLFSKQCKTCTKEAKLGN